MREIVTSATGTNTGYPFLLKCLALFLQNCCGFTNASESTAAGSFFSTYNSGVNGSINPTGSDKDFEDTTAASFVAGDVGKWLLVYDNVNPRNSGWYAITALVSASKVTIDFRSAAAEYPTQNTGANLSWWLASNSIDCPTSDGDYWRLQTPHAAGWELEVKLRDTSNNRGLVARVATDGNWGGDRILPETYVGVSDNDATWGYAIAETDGSSVHFVHHNSTNNEYQGFIVSNLTLIEADREDFELVGLTGQKSVNTGGNFYQRYYNNQYLPTDVWDERLYTIKRGYMVEMSYQNNDEGFCRWASRQVNHRNGDQWDVLEGQPVLADPYNGSVDGQYEWLGQIPSIMLTSQVVSVRTAIDYEATKDIFHFQTGLAIKWPSVTPQH